MGNSVLEVVACPEGSAGWSRNGSGQEAQEPHAPAPAQPGAEQGRSNSPDLPLMLPSTQLTRMKLKMSVSQTNKLPFRSQKALRLSPRAKHVHICDSFHTGGCQFPCTNYQIVAVSTFTQLLNAPPSSLCSIFRRATHLPPHPLHWYFYTQSIFGCL